MALPTVSSVLTSNIAQYPTVYYDRTAVKELHANLHMYPCIDQKPMPDRSGVAMQIFGYVKLGANTTPSTDGTPQAAGVALTASTATLSLSQYVDYVSYSDKVILTNIDPVIEAGARLLAYRGALTVDNLIITAVDTVAAADAVARIDLSHLSYMTASVGRKAAAQLRSVDAVPRSGGLFQGVIHSLLTFDLINDSGASGYQDAFRFINPKQLQNDVDQAGDQRVAILGGISWTESNNTTVTANYQSTGVNGYTAYVFGQDAFFCSSLGKTALGQKNFSVQTKMYDGTNSLDPAGVIRAASVYSFYFGIKGRPQSATNTFRRIRSESTIG